MYKLVITEEADKDITAAYIYYEDKQVGLGERFLLQLEKYLGNISQNPKHFAVKRANYREAFLRSFPYLIIYEIEDDKIIIYSVFNTPQDPLRKPV